MEINKGDVFSFSLLLFGIMIFYYPFILLLTIGTVFVMVLIFICPSCALMKIYYIAGLIACVSLAIYVHELVQFLFLNSSVKIKIINGIIILEPLNNVPVQILRRAEFFGFLIPLLVGIFMFFYNWILSIPFFLISLSPLLRVLE